jgi:hypothetical protein
MEATLTLRGPGTLSTGPRYHGSAATASTMERGRIPSHARTLAGRISDGWQLEPLSVEVEQDSDGSILVSENIFLMYGTGATEAAAIQDYTLSLVEYYGLLEASAVDNPLDREAFQHLQLYLKPTSPRSPYGA